MKWKFLFLVLFLFGQNALATHLRGGEITAKRISNTSLTYRVTLTVYFDEVGGRRASQDQDRVTFFMGVSGSKLSVRRKAYGLVNRNTSVNVYDTTFTFPAPGKYIVRCGIENRNTNVINVGQPSDDKSFFVESTLVINGALGLNSTPVLLNVPVDSAAVGVRYIHNPAAFDADGDSLAYRLSIPKQDVGKSTPTGDGITGEGIFIKGYQSPETIGTAPILGEDGVTAAIFTINSLTGDLIWDAPRKEGQYNVAFIVEEWRNGVKIGEIVRDMQIIVVETTNKAPRLEVPTEICVEAGQSVNFTVKATDRDGHRMKITTASGVYNADMNNILYDFIVPEIAKFVVSSEIQASPATGTFSWNTNCKHVRFQPYDVLFKVEDFPGRLSTQLVDIKTVKIKVIAPRPQNLTAKIESGGVALNWKAYTACIATKAEIVVYRRDGCTSFKPDKCQTGIPAALGYKEIARLPSGDSTFLDKTALRGNAYSYRIVAAFLPPANAQSVASDEACMTLPEQMPVMTHLSILKTDTKAGEILVRWTRPIGLDTATSKAPYQYRLLRATGTAGTDFAEVLKKETKLNDAPDTLFVETGLNTTDNAYRYKLEFYFSDKGIFKKLDETFAASTVRLSVQPEAKQMRLNWSASTPWRNDNQKHRVYRQQKDGSFNLIAEVSVQGANTFTYLDNGSDAVASDGNTSVSITTDTQYCYKVETVGKYEEKRLAFLGRFDNASQETCGMATDDTPPCPPVLRIDELNCKTITCQQTSFSNVLTWSVSASANCRIDQIEKYNVYYVRYKTDKPKLLSSLEAKTYTHTGLPDFSGCYTVKSVNRMGVESAASNMVCKDNCSELELPNVFTPNGDGKNDTFTALDCSPFLQSISFQVYNRWGGLVYESTAVPFAWDGRNTLGEELPAGLYYYLVQATFNRLDKKDEAPQTFKGWVELLR